MLQIGALLNKQCRLPGRKIWVCVCPLVALSVATVRSTLEKSGIVCLEEEGLMFWCSLVGVNRPPKEAMPVAIACLEQEDLGFGVLCWERKVIRAEKIADGRIPLPARYISENRGTVLEKSRCGRVHPAVFRTRQGKSGFHAVNK